MGRPRLPYRLKNCSGYWYYKTEDMASFKTTGQRVKAVAQKYVLDLLKNGTANKANPTFKEYAEPYFLLNKCPHANRLLAEGKHITKRYCEQERRFLEKHVLCSAFAKKHMLAIKRSDILDFMVGLQAKGISANTINGVLKAIKVILTEATYREDIPSNPASMVGKLNTNNKEAGTFTEQELLRLFHNPKDSLLWHTPSDYVCFYIAAATGMRKCEVLALKWKNVDLTSGVIDVCEAWKDNLHSEIGLPKNYTVRQVPIPSSLVKVLRRYRALLHDCKGNTLVVRTEEGKPYNSYKWDKAFKVAVNGIGISDAEIKERHLKPHSLRHTLNTLLVQRGADPASLRLSFGWADEVIQENYTHVDVATDEKNRGMIEAIFGNAG